MHVNCVHVNLLLFYYVNVVQHFDHYWKSTIQEPPIIIVIQYKPYNNIMLNIFLDSLYVIFFLNIGEDSIFELNRNTES